MPKLQITLPDGSLLDHELTEAVTIGRVSDNTLPIDDASISGHHARLSPGEQGYILTDLGSTNGTRLNGAPVNPDEQHVLSPGDKMSFGNVHAIYDPENAAEDAQDLPEAKHVAKVASKSVKPSNFSNASPFEKKSKKKDPVALAVTLVGVLAILAALVTLTMVFGLKTA